MIFYLFAVPPLVLIAFIMLCRVNDLRWQSALIKRIRLIGLILSGIAPWGILYWDYWINRTLPSPFDCLLYVGLGAVFITTPYGVPFWRWLWVGEDCHVKADPGE